LTQKIKKNHHWGLSLSYARSFCFKNRSQMILDFNLFRLKLSKTAANSDHNIDPTGRCYDH
jgi:hypothetical protein